MQALTWSSRWPGASANATEKAELSRNGVRYAVRSKAMTRNVIAFHHQIDRLAATGGSIVVGLVHGDRTMLPIGGGLYTVLRQSALIDEITAKRLGGPRLRRHPGIAFA